MPPARTTPAARYFGRSPYLRPTYHLPPCQTIHPRAAYTGLTLPDGRCGRIVGVPHAPGHPRLQGPELDEPGRGVLREQAPRLGERRERRVVHGVRRLPG